MDLPSTSSASFPESMEGTIVDALLDVTKKKIEAFCEERLNGGTNAYEIIDDITRVLREIGEGYKERYFDAELMVSGWNAKKALEILKPLLQEKEKGEGAFENEKRCGCIQNHFL